MPKGRRSKAGRTKDRNPVSIAKRWTIAQRIAVISIIVSFFGGVVPAAFANWDRIFPRQTLNLEEVAVRTTFLKDRQRTSLESMDTAERNIDEAMKAVEVSEQLSPADKKAAAKTAEELKTIVRTHKPELQRIFERSHEALKSGNSVEADLLQRQLLQRILDLQREFDQKVEPTPLKDLMPDVNFKCNEERTKHPTDWAEVPTPIKGTG